LTLSNRAGTGVGRYTVSTYTSHLSSFSGVNEKDNTRKLGIRREGEG